MPSFPLSDQGYRYRPLRLTEPFQSGWDIYALQTGLGVVADGVFGPKTDESLRAFQKKRKLVSDGVAGVKSQRELALWNLWPEQDRLKTPPGLARGQLEAESSYWVGNHSPRYENGSYDVGVAQRNSQFATLEDGFSVPLSIKTLCERLRQKFDAYHGDPGAKTERRAWELAAGSWNAPAWTGRLAAGQSLSDSQRQHIESYIERVTVYFQ